MAVTALTFPSAAEAGFCWALYGAARSRALTKDHLRQDTGYLSSQSSRARRFALDAFLGVVHDGHRAVRAGKVELDLAGGAQDFRGSDLGLEILHAIRHINQNVM